MTFTGESYSNSSAMHHHNHMFLAQMYVKLGIESMLIAMGGWGALEEESGAMIN